MTNHPIGRAPSFEQKGERVALTVGQLERLRLAEKLSASRKVSDRRLACDMVRQLVAEIGDRVEMSLVSRGILETVKLELSRFEANLIERASAKGATADAKQPKINPDDLVDLSPRVGYCRLKDRDGLRTLFENGRICGDHYRAGSVYRRLHEDASSAGGRSQLDDTVRSTMVDVVGIGLRRAKASTLKTAIDIEVAVRLKSEPVALQALRLVAGEGRSVRSMVSGSKGFDRTVKALTGALGIAAEMIG